MIVYLVTNNINSKQYVGQTSQDLMKRWKGHQRPFNQRKNSYLYNAIQKYGEENFTVKPLLVVDSKEAMDYYEIEMIRLLDLRNPDKGYNLTDGGGGMLGFKLSKKTKKRMSEHIKTEEHCQKISISKLGNQARLGMKHSEKTKRKMSKVAKGRIFSAEHRKNHLAAQQRRRERELAAKNLSTGVPVEGTGNRELQTSTLPS